MTTIKEKLKEIDEKMKKALELGTFQEFQQENHRLYLERNRILSQCKHEIDKIPSKKSGYINCKHCKQLFWYCPESPNHFCKYEDQKDPMHDECLYCGKPEERK